MNLEDFLAFKKKLEDTYYDPKCEDVLLDAIPGDRSLDETMKFCSMLCQSDELIQEFLMEDDMKSLGKYLSLSLQTLLKKYGKSGEVLRELCNTYDYTAIKVFFDRTYENIMYGPEEEIDILDKEFCGKVSMIFDFYQDILKNDFTSTFDYAKRCVYINNLCLLVNSYNKSRNSNHK